MAWLAQVHEMIEYCISMRCSWIMCYSYLCFVCFVCMCVPFKQFVPSVQFPPASLRL